MFQTITFVPFYLRACRRVVGELIRFPRSNHDLSSFPRENDVTHPDRSSSCNDPYANRPPRLQVLKPSVHDLVP